MGNILSQGSWWILNKALTLALGLDASYLLSDLTSRHEYWERVGELTKDGYFFCTKDQIEKDTSLSPYKQTEAVKVLVEAGLLQTKRMGNPAKLYYQLNFKNINSLLYKFHSKKK